MRPRPLLALPLLGGAAALLLSVAGGPRPWHAVGIGAQALAAAGCLAAAAALGRRDFMFRAWALYALSHALPAARRLVLGTGFWWRDERALAVVADAAYILVVNGARVAGSVLFVRAFARAGLGAALPGRSRAGVAVAVAALALGAPTLVAYVQSALAAGTPRAAFWGGVAIAADTACFLLVVPLARIARAFRGGVLQAPWAFLAAANLGWLLYDASRTAARLAGWGDAARAASEAVLVAACLCALAAGLAHRAAVAHAKVAAGSIDRAA
jgi:hypothetical protein